MYFLSTVLTLSSYPSSPSDQVEALASPPAARLVGVETNPGPKSGGLNPALIAAAASAAATLIARTVKAKAKKKKVKKTEVSIAMNTGSSRQVLASVSRGVQMRSSTAHTPFILRGRSVAGTVIGRSGNIVAFQNVSSSVGPASFNVDLLGASNNSIDFKSFLPTVTNVATSFTRYRFKRLVFTYNPSCSTTTAASFIFGVSPEVLNSNTSLSASTVSALQVNCQTPAWSGVSLDLLQDGALRKDWLYLDSTVTSDQASLRQEAAGTFAVTNYGSVALDVIYGTLHWDYEIELEGLGAEVSFGSEQAPVRESTQVSEPEQFISVPYPPSRYVGPQSSLSSSSSSVIQPNRIG